MSGSKPKIIVVLGPTASGKSDFAIGLAQKFNGEIISADSRQIYKGLDIGSNKTLPKQQQDIPHYLIDIVNPDREYTLHNWQIAAFKIIDKILHNQKLPIICGGTGLYISSILQNYQLPQINPTLKKELKTYTLEKLAEQLKKIDPDTAKNIDLKNKVRVLRALEYALTFQESLHLGQKQKPCPYDFLVFGLNPDREILYKKIDQRTDQMIKQGLVSEVKNLYKQYADKTLPALSGIGYQEIIKYLNHEIDLSEAVALIKKNTRGYAKRQLTWFRRMERQGIKIHWNQNLDSASVLINNFLKN